MRISRLLGAIATLSVLVLSNPAWAKNIYVRAGSSGDGTKASPFGTIEDALLVAYSGDVIHVAEGLYFGEGGGGYIAIKKPNLTLVGGYNKDFSARHPFKHLTVVMRGSNKDDNLKECERVFGGKCPAPETKASYNPNAMIRGEGDSTGTVIDGFVLDGFTRNSYKPNGDLKRDIGPIGTPLVSFNKPGAKVRNCVIINSGGGGVQMVASGTVKEEATYNEVSNNVILNTLMQCIDFRVGDFDPTNAPKGGVAVVKNNTCAFTWEEKGEGYGLLIGRQTRLKVENNIFSYAQSFGMNNGLQNDKAQVVDNWFWDNRGGTYRYWAKDSKLTVVEDDPAKLAGPLTEKKYCLSNKSKGNNLADPAFSPDPDFTAKWDHFQPSTGGGEVDWNAHLNQQRSILGLPLVGSAATGKSNFAPVYAQKHMLLFSDAAKSAGVGALFDGPFEAYSSTTGDAADKEYVEATIEELHKAVFEKIAAAGEAGQPVAFKAKLASQDMSSWYVEKIKPQKSSYVIWRLEGNPQIFTYVAKGTPAEEAVAKAKKDGTEITIKGTAFDIRAGIKASAPRVGVVVDEIAADSNEDF